MPVWIFKRVIAANGCPVTYLGPSLRLQDHEIAAAYIEVSRAALEAARNRTGVRHTVLTQYPLNSRAGDSPPNVPPYHPVVPLDPVEIDPLATSLENRERKLTRFVPVNSTSAPVSRRNNCKSSWSATSAGVPGDGATLLRAEITRGLRMIEISDE